jgi:hypothetical protein
MNRICRIAVGLAVIVSATQTESRQTNDEHVRFVVGLKAIGLPFADKLRSEPAVFFTGEPIDITLTLVNATSNPIRPVPSWPSTARLDLIRTGGSAPAISIRTPTSAASAPGDDPIQAHASKGFEFRLSPSTSGSLHPGTYELKASLPLSSLPGQSATSNDALRATKVFEVREPETQIDHLNHWHHLAVRARWAGDFEQAKKWLDAIIAERPNSPTPYSELGAVFSRERDCASAKKAYERAAALAEAGGGGDDRIIQSPMAVEEWTAEMRAAAIRCR